MRSVFFAVSCLAFATLPAAALEKELVDQIVQSAQNIARDAGGVGQALKSKKFDAATVAKNINAMDADVATLQEAITKFDSTHPNLSTRDRADWELLKTKVHLIGIFQDQKQKLAAEDISKNRGIIRDHAAGLAQRARKLQETAEKLRRS